MKIKPLLDRVVLKQDGAKEATESGLLFPDASKEKPLSGIVLAKGELASCVEINDKVLYHKYRGEEISINGELFMIMKQDDLIAII